MTAQPHISAFQSSEDIEGFCVLRSNLIDEFARLELAVNRCLGRLGLLSDPRRSTLGHRLGELSKARPSPCLSNVKAAALESLGRDCEPLQRLRASVVHGVMELGTRGDEPIAVFHNVADAVANEPVCHVLSALDFRQSIHSVREMTERVANCLNQPV